MHDHDPLTRRRFLASAGATTALGWRIGPGLLAAIAQAACSARQDDAPWRVLGDEDAADLAAMAARIIPTTDTPGATEAGVIHFFDQALAGEMSDVLPFIREGLSDLNAGLDGRFAAQDTDAQDDRLRAIEDGSYFQLVRTMTLFGFFAMSRYGGNRDHQGWALLDFDGHHGAWTYPFGHYDAGYDGSDDGGE